jgi:hypothetical protein
MKTKSCCIRPECHYKFVDSRGKKIKVDVERWRKSKFAFPTFWPLGVDSREEKPGSYAHITVVDEGHERPPAVTPHRRHAR